MPTLLELFPFFVKLLVHRGSFVVDQFNFIGKPLSLLFLFLFQSHRVVVQFGELSFFHVLQLLQPNIVPRDFFFFFLPEDVPFSFQRLHSFIYFIDGLFFHFRELIVVPLAFLNVFFFQPFDQFFALFDQLAFHFFTVIIQFQHQAKDVLLFILFDARTRFFKLHIHLVSVCSQLRQLFFRSSPRSFALVIKCGAFGFQLLHDGLMRGIVFVHFRSVD